jgi:hypothetical protein
MDGGIDAPARWAARSRWRLRYLAYWVPPSLSKLSTLSMKASKRCWSGRDIGLAFMVGPIVRVRFSGGKLFTNWLGAFLHTIAAL